VRYQVIVEGRTFDIEVTPDGQVWVNNQPLNVDLESINGLPLYSLLVDHRSYEAHLEKEENGDQQVVVAGRSYRATMRGESQPTKKITQQQKDEGPSEISAPLPGWLVELRVAEGESVVEGDVVAVLESMKMHLELRTAREGVVRSISASAGQVISQGEIIAVIDDLPGV
jgi:biotin carboxyl carrier protein